MEYKLYETDTDWYESIKTFPSYLNKVLIFQLWWPRIYTSSLQRRKGLSTENLKTWLQAQLYCFNNCVTLRKLLGVSESSCPLSDKWY